MMGDTPDTTGDESDFCGNNDLSIFQPIRQNSQRPFPATPVQRFKTQTLNNTTLDITNTPDGGSFYLVGEDTTSDHFLLRYFPRVLIVL
jgi:hypothetical protein